MNTEAQPSDPDDHASPDDGWRVSYGRYLRRQYLIVALAAYFVSALFGLYADWKFWSYFDLQYLRYAGLGDYVLAPVSFLRMVVDPSFIAVFLIFGILLLLVAGCCGYVVKIIRGFTQHGPAGKGPATNGETLPLTDHWPDHKPFRSYLRSLAQRPLWAAPILAIAAILAINVNATSEKRDLRSFAKLIQHAYATDKYQKFRVPYSRYELVSIGMLAPTERREHLIRLRSTDGFVFYYNVLDDQPVVVSEDRVSSEVADASLADSPPAAAASGELEAGLAERGAADGVVSPPRVRSGATDLTLPVQQTLASEAAQPTGGMAGSSQIAPAAVAGEPVATKPSPKPEVIFAMDTAAQGEPASPATVVPEQHPNPPAAATALPAPPTAAAGSAGPRNELDTIDVNVRQSQGSLDGLKSYLQQMESSFVEIHKFINELDGSLKQIDEAFGQLAEQQTAVEQDPYADCPELTADRPLEFGADGATLSLEAVGWLFKARRELTAQRSVERREWLVIEGHADAAGQPAVDPPPLSIQRAGAVRDFLKSELGVPADVMKVVGKSASGSSGRFVSLYDCLERQPPTARPAPATAKVALVQSAAAGEVVDAGPVRPAAWKPGEDADGLSAMLDPRPEDRGLLVTVPGDRLFETDSSRIQSSAYGLIGEIGEALIREPGRRALIVGHSDAIGDAAYNRILSERRARAVRDFLVDNFRIASDRFSVEGRGEDDPIATNDTPAGRLANRRVEVLLLN